MKVFISGVTGSLGTELAHLHHELGDEVVGCARSESKIVEWRRKQDVATVYTCDINSLGEVGTDVTSELADCDRCYHLAALKHVDICERQPEEAIAQNVHRTTHISHLCKTLGVELIFVSSDKACLPQGVYGATKLLAEIEVLRRDGAVVRFGNLIGSSGSVFQTWKKAVDEKKPIQVTNPLMTRYFIPTITAAQFLIDMPVLGKIVAPCMQSVQIGAVAARIAGSPSSPNIKIIGQRPGETQHQHLFPPESRIKTEPGRHILDKDGTYHAQGMHSLYAEHWNVDRLLELAGVII